ncbi:hypothetical protein J4N45_10130 [Vibrio sp. SCSIO 43140]|uniref:hypothetical protein n=1 Tax=Vibrio sp. SCSIO 43140 TaxID=2819100 RepID=UPI002076625E|nr:hypothetical protein [Vibrio sp. SCSIO 43140]USD58887.1 hypothetical protein J4N45_10130 [Vibrio sp. SCSIO 43140]
MTDQLEKESNEPQVYVLPDYLQFTEEDVKLSAIYTLLKINSEMPHSIRALLLANLRTIAEYNNDRAMLASLDVADEQIGHEMRYRISLDENGMPIKPTRIEVTPDESVTVSDQISD